MKAQETLNKIKDKLEQILIAVPFIKINESLLEARLGNVRVDLIVKVNINGRLLSLLVEFKSLGEPRMVRMAIQQLREYSSLTENAYPVVAAPYISEDTANLCKQNKVGYIDLAGNCFLTFHRVYIERKYYPNPIIEKRRVRSIFSPKSSRILRVMLNYPQRRPWGVWELAKEANVSIGLVSKVKERLLDLEYISGDKYLSVIRPVELLEEWASNYSFKKNKIYDYFSFDDIKDIERKLSEYCKQQTIPYALTLFSGAALVAPFSRYTRGFAYVGNNISEVADKLGLKEVTSGPNISILEPYDEGVFYGSNENDDVSVVSDIQLYLDLIGFKGRGEESAKFLLEQRIKPKW
ncbi:MAG: type IV toxin-antitoxin system AbiEi family antitoxin [Dehalococcoidia bacterium]|nr:type IV toxin-antitoxin system AbiEi family antitoxin [Dehalococcoidia bacterium]